MPTSSAPQMEGVTKVGSEQTALVGVKTMAPSLPQAFPGENSLPDCGSQPSSQDQIKGVPFPPWPIVSDGLKIAAMKLREGSGQSTEDSKSTA